MCKVTYGRMLLNEFSNMRKEYDYLGFLRKLEEDRLYSLNTASEADIKKHQLYKEHYLVRFIRKTTLEIMEIESQLTDNNLIDTSKIGNTPRFKNDLMSLQFFISKLESLGYKKSLKVS